MRGAQRTEMDAIQIVDFLDTQQTGVLSLARENDSYGIPVSFAFDDTEHDIYLHLGYGSSSTKREFVDAVEWASFLVYDRVDGKWKSVLARGTLEGVSEDSIDSTAYQAAKSLNIPYFQVFGDRDEALEFEIVRMDITELTGIVSGGGA